MAEVTLEVVRREQAGKSVARKLRADGKVPAVVYGGHREPVAITVDRKSITDLIQKSEHGVRSIFLLKMAGSDQQRHAMIKDVQIHPITRKMQHVDFVRVLMDEVVRVTVPVHVTGSAPGVKAGGLLETLVREIHVETLPGNIPDVVEVDVSGLDMHQYIRISDLKLPEGVKVLDDPERVVVGVTHMRAEVVEVPVAVDVTAVAAEPEVIAKGKKPEEETEK